MEDLMRALLGAEPRVECYREYPLLAWPFLPAMVNQEPGL